MNECKSVKESNVPGPRDVLSWLCISSPVVRSSSITLNCPAGAVPWLSHEILIVIKSLTKGDCEDGNIEPSKANKSAFKSIEASL